MSVYEQIESLVTERTQDVRRAVVAEEIAKAEAQALAVEATLAELRAMDEQFTATTAEG